MAGSSCDQNNGYRFGRSGTARVRGAALAAGLVGSIILAAVGSTATAATRAAAATCRSGTGEKISDPVTCKGLSFYRGKSVLLWANGSVGAASDNLFRAIAPSLASYLDCTVNVGDEATGGGIAGTNVVADSPPNGLEVGYLEVSQDTEDQAENVPGPNFPLSKIVSVGGVNGTVAALVSSSASGIKTIKQLLNDPQPTRWLEILNSSFEPLMKMVIAAYGVHTAQIVTGYGSSGALTQGFERGDGQVTGTSLSTLGPLILAGKAIALMSDKPTHPGYPYYQQLKDVPTPASMLKTDPPKTPGGKKIMQALEIYENSSMSILEMPPRTPKADSAAMAAAVKWAFAQPSVEAAIVAGGTPPGLISVPATYKILSRSIANEKFLARFLA